MLFHPVQKLFPVPEPGGYSAPSSLGSAECSTKTNIVTIPISVCVWAVRSAVPYIIIVTIPIPTDQRPTAMQSNTFTEDTSSCYKVKLCLDHKVCLLISKQTFATSSHQVTERVVCQSDSNYHQTLSRHSPISPLSLPFPSLFLTLTSYVIFIKKTIELCTQIVIIIIVMVQLRRTPSRGRECTAMQWHINTYSYYEYMNIHTNHSLQLLCV